MSTINSESIICNNFNTNHNKYSAEIAKTVKVTFDNTSSSDNFLKNAGFFTISFPAHFYIDTVYVMFSNTDIVMGGTDITLLNIADGTNALVGSATNITIGSPPGAAGLIVGNSNTTRAKGKFADGNTGILSGSSFNVNPDAADVTTEDRVFTGVIYHDASGVNDGNGDGATHVSGLDTAIVYIAFQGTRFN